VGHATRSIPVTPPHAPSALSYACPQPEPAGVPQAQQGETVLVVDEEPIVRMLVTEVLEELGYTAIEAAMAPVACTCCARHSH
jgi:hypothetical protein